ncbi:HoxN/HupN/NixA family nickel/cobalt transporter [Aurantivibrio plasticivorans]
MDIVISAYFTAFILGAIHAIELDHLVAVSVFAGLRPKLKAAASYGARWGLGHAAIVVLVGSILAALNIRLDAYWQYWGEALVGVALIGLAVWAIAVSVSNRGVVSRNESLVYACHSQPDGLDHGLTQSQRHRHIPTAMGALHGLAGSAPLLALIPITLLNDFKQALIYLVLFSVGTTLAMVIYAVTAACAVQGLGAHKLGERWLSFLIAAITFGVGVFWLVQAWANL